MGKFSDALLTEQAQAEAAPAPKAGKYSAPLLSPQQEAMLDEPETQYSGALYDTPDGRSPAPEHQRPVEGRGVGLVGNFKAGMVDDPDTKLRLLAKARFPNDPKAIERFGWRDGNPVFINEQGKLERADTGLASGAGEFGASLPEFVGGLVGSLTPAAPFGGSVAGSVAGKGLKQMVAGAVLGEPQTVGGNTAGLVKEGAVSAVGGIPGKLGTMAANRTAIPSAEKFDAVGARATIDRLKASLGIDLDTAQVANVRGLRDLKKWAFKHQGDAAEFIEALDTKQQGQVATAIEERLLARLSKANDPVEMANSGVTGAKSAITMAQQKRAADTRELFRAAERDLISPESYQHLTADPFIQKELQKVLNDPLHRGEFKNLGLLPEMRDSVTNMPIRGARPASPASPGTPAQSPVPGDSLMNNPLGRRDSVMNMPVQGSSPAIPGKPETRAPDLGLGNADRSVKAWDLALRNMRDEAAELRRGGNKNKARLIDNRADALESELRTASKPYGKARDAWAAASKDYVEPLENGVIGLIAESKSPVIAKKIGEIVSGDVLTSPRVASQVRGALVAAGQEQAWNDLLKLSLAKSFNKAMRKAQSGDQVNVAGKFLQEVAGTPQQQLALNVSVGSAVHPILNDLTEALGYIAKEGRNRSGSDTAFMLDIGEKQKGGAAGAMVKSIMSPRETLLRAIDSRTLESNAKAFAEALADPDKVARLKELRKLKPSTERAVAMLSVVGAGSFALGGAVDQLEEPVDAGPGATEQTVP